MAQLRNSSLLFCVVVLLASCDGTVYHRFGQVEGSVWSLDDTLSFVYEGTDSLVAGDAIEAGIQVRHSAAYRFKELCVRVEAYRADSSLLLADTLRCTMYDDAGRRSGSTAGTLYQVSGGTLLLDALPTDTLIFRLSHVMSYRNIEGVYEVGLKLKSVKR